LSEEMARKGKTFGKIQKRVIFRKERKKDVFPSRCTDKSEGRNYKEDERIQEVPSLKEKKSMGKMGILTEGIRGEIWRCSSSMEGEASY